MRMVIRKNNRLNLNLTKCFRCGSEDHLIAKFPKPTKYNKKQQKQVRFSERVIHA